MTTTPITQLDVDDLRCMAEAAEDDLRRTETALRQARLNHETAVRAYILGSRQLMAQLATPTLAPPGAMRLPTDMTT